jgi:aminoglycoside phosphotransferase (APT) family kinase protein
MSTPLDGLDLPAVERFLAEHVPGYTGGLRAELVPGGRSNLTYILSSGTHRWVLRRPPLGGLTPSAHDVGREYQVTAALGDSAVPVARAVALAGPDVYGVPFSVVEFVDGQVIRTTGQLAALAPADITRCADAAVDVLARLHQIEPAAYGLAGFGRPEGYLGRQVRRWYDQWHRVQAAPLDDIDTLHDRLAEACPAESGASIVHGDYRIDNLILDRDDPAVIRAVVDWEMATLGDPLADLGLHLAYADPAFAVVLGGSAASTSELMPSTAHLAERYAGTSGRDLARLDFYLGLGYFKIAVIAAGIDYRYRQGGTRGDGFDRVGEAVAPLAAEGLRALSHSV